MGRSLRSEFIGGLLKSLSLRVCDKSFRIIDDHWAFGNDLEGL